MVGVDKAEGVQAAAFGVARARADFFGQVALHEGQSFVFVPAMNHAQGRGRRQLGPVRRSRQPFQIISGIAKKNVYFRFNFFF